MEKERAFQGADHQDIHLHAGKRKLENPTLYVV